MRGELIIDSNRQGMAKGEVTVMLERDSPDGPLMRIVTRRFQQVFKQRQTTMLL